MAIDQGEYQARRVEARVGAANPNDATREGRAAREAADTLRREREEDPARDILARQAEEAADREPVDPALREKFLKENIGVVVPGSTERDRPAGSIYEMRYNRATAQAELVENFINNGYDGLINPTDFEFLQNQVEQVLSKYPGLRDRIPVNDPANPTAREEYLESFLRSREARAAIRASYLSSLNIENVSPVNEQAIAAKIAEIDENIRKSQRKVADAIRDRDAAGVAAGHGVAPAGSAEGDLDQERINTAETALIKKTREIRDVKDVFELAKADRREFEEILLDAGSNPVLDTAGNPRHGKYWQELQDARAILGTHSIKDIAELQSKADDADGKVASLDALIKGMMTAKDKPTTYADDLASLESKQIDEREKSRKAKSEIQSYNDAKKIDDEFQQKKINAQAKVDNAEDDLRTAERGLLTLQHRRDEARGAARPWDDVLAELDEKWVAAEQDLINLQRERAAAQADLERGRIDSQEAIVKKFSAIVENGLDKFITDALKDAAIGDKEFRDTWEKNAKTKIDKALANFLADELTEPGTRGFGIGGRNINIRGRNIHIPRIGAERNAEVPNAAAINDLFERFLGHGQMQTENLREVFEDIVDYQAGEVADGRMRAEDALTQAEIDEHFADKNTRDATIRDLAVNLVSARLRLGRMDHLDAADVNHVLNGIASGDTPEEREKWTLDVLKNAVEINTHQKDVEKAMRTGGVVQRDVMDYARRLVDSKNSTGLITLLALLVGGVVPAGIAWYAMNQRGGGAAGA